MPEVLDLAYAPRYIVGAPKRIPGGAVWAKRLLCGQERPSMRAARLKHVANFEGGRFSRLSDYGVLELQGGYRQMGRQYGALMKGQLQDCYKLAMEDTLLKDGMTYQVAAAIAASFFSTSPQRYQEFALGMAKTSDMPLEKLYMLNSIYAFPKLTGSEAHCSGTGAWGEYTSGKPLVFGRSFDYPEYFLRFNRYLNLVAYRPGDGSIPTAVLDYPGHIGAMTGMNREGLFLEYNDGTMSGGTVIAKSGVDPMMLNLSYLLDSVTMTQIDAAISGHRAGVAAIIQVADKESAVSYECSTWDTRRRPADRPGLLAATNHFIDPSWNIALLSDPWQSQTRRNNLLALCEKHKTRLSPETMMRILDTPIDKGGQLSPGITIYLVVAVPAELKLWVRALDRTDWTPFDLEPLLK